MREVIVLSVALAVTLVASYVSWTSDEEVIDDESVRVYSASAKDLVSITWESEELTAVITRESDDKGEYLWVDTETRKKTPIIPEGDEEEPATDKEVTAEQLQDVLDEADDTDAASDTDAPDEPHIEYETEVTKKAFKGSSQAQDLWEDFAPLQALRALSSSDSESFGFDDPFATITVGRKNGDLELTVGGETYGRKDRYVRLKKRVYLVEDNALRPLEFATARLLDRALTPLSAEDILEVRVTQPSGTELTFVQLNADDPGAAYWASKEDPGTPDEAAGTWVDKLFRMRLRSFVQPDDEVGDVQPRLTYTAVDEAGESWMVEVFEGTDDDGKRAFFARGEHTRVMVEVPASLAASVVDDLESLGG